MIGAGLQKPSSVVPLRQSGGARTALDVVRGNSVSILEDITHAGVAASVWQRRLQADLQQWVAGLPVELLPSLRIVVPAHLAETALLSSPAICELADAPGRDLFVKDAAALARILARVLKVEHVRIRFEPSVRTVCPKFHLDHVPARLLCTYRGAGTEYVPEASCDVPSRYRRLLAGEVGLFRGRLWQADAPCGLLHRSPEQGEGSEARLLLVIDPVE